MTPSRPPPLSPLALDESIAGSRYPCAGRVEIGIVSVAGPGVEQRIEPGQGRLHLVAASKERRLAEHGVEQQPLIRLRWLGAEGRRIAELHRHRRAAHGRTRHLRVELQ